jgi:imidazolonepropionase-like amidohydrolase
MLSAGVKVSVAAHDPPAILTHFEMWMLVRGGATPGQAIRSATMTGAEKLGIQQDVGSLEPGKIADFLVLKANPLEKIENSLSLKYTIADGIIYDSDTLEILDPTKLIGGYKSHVR